MNRASVLLVFLCVFLCFSSALIPPSNLHPHAKRRLMELKKIHNEGVQKSLGKGDIPSYQTAFFTNMVDHFDFHNDATYQMRYLFNDDLWSASKKDPIFFYCGNEDDIVSFWNNSGFLTQTLRKEFNALVLFAEHRYFGESMPYSDSYSQENLQQLTVAQAMADYGVFLTAVKYEIFKCVDCPIIAFGGSYGGMLAAWMRFKYPHLIDGSIAASAPIIFYDTPYAWMQTVTEDYEKAAEKSNVDCVNLIRKGFDIMAQQTDASGWEQLDTIFNLCPESEVTSYEDVEALQEWVVGSLTTLAMLDYPYETDFLAPIPGNPVNYACEEFQGLSVDTSTDEEILEAMLETALVYYPPNDEGCNYPFEEETIKNNPLFGWEILACTDMVFPIGTNNETDMFPPGFWDIDAYAEGCFDAFGVQTRPDWAMTYFGGLEEDQLMGYSNVFFSNGNLDPWRNFGVLESISDSLVAFYIDGSAHHLDLRLPTEKDPIGVVNARSLEMYWIGEWMREKEQLIAALGESESHVYNSQFSREF